MRGTRSFCSSLTVVLGVLSLAIQSGVFAQDTPPVSVFDTPVEFSGSVDKPPNIKQPDEIRIGFFAPGDSGTSIGYAMLNAARLAIAEANAAGGWQGCPFKLVQRWSDKPWEGAAKEVIRLVYEDSVWAIIGSLDGQTTHIAEQVTTKAWVPLLSPVSADPTLTYIRLPWIFRLPPDTEEQTNVIVEDGIKAMALTRVGLITSTDHDGRVFADAASRSLATAELSPIFHFQVSPHFDVATIRREVESFGPDGLVLSLPHDELPDLLAALKKSDTSVPLFVPWVPELDGEGLAELYSGEVFFVQPFSSARNPDYPAFVRQYRERFGHQPEASAAYTYDAVNLVIQSLRRSGLNRAALRDSIFAVKGFQGVTGSFEWDNGGGNKSRPVLRKTH